MCYTTHLKTTSVGGIELIPPPAPLLGGRRVLPSSSIGPHYLVLRGAFLPPMGLVHLTRKASKEWTDRRTDERESPNSSSLHTGQHLTKDGPNFLTPPSSSLIRVVDRLGRLCQRPSIQRPSASSWRSCRRRSPACWGGADAGAARCPYWRRPS